MFLNKNVHMNFSSLTISSYYKFVIIIDQYFKQEHACCRFSFVSLRERETDHVTVSSNQRCLYESAVRSAWCWIVVIKPYLKLLPMMLKISYRFQLFKCWSNKFHTSPPFCEKNLLKILDNRRLLQDVFPPPKYEIILI